MRRPNVHKLLGISNRIGLSDLIRGKMTLHEVTQISKNLRNLHVITSGSLPPNPSDLITSKKMAAIIETLRERYDMILIDTPPAIVSDAQVLSTKSDGVIFVLRPGKSRTIAVKTPLEEFYRVGAKVIGVVMNRIPRNRGYYYGGYEYYGPKPNTKEKYYRSDSKDEGSGQSDQMDSQGSVGF
jgi:capsular exopolysaccharide synthesis family protein